MALSLDASVLFTGGRLLAGAAVVSAGFALGRPLTNYLLPRLHGSPARLQACLIGLGLLSVIDLVLAGIGVFRPAVLTVMVVSLAIAGVAMLATNVRPTLPRTRPSVSTLALCALLGLLFVAAAIGALAPETQYDALWYHLGFPAEWLRTGRLTFFPWEFVSAYPFATELLNGNAIALGGPIAAKVVNLAFGVLLVWATFDLGRRLFSRRAALLAACCLALAPTVIWEATTANIDLAAAAFVVLAVDVAVARHAWPDRRSAVACGLLTGFAIATKLTTVFAVPTIFLVVIAGSTAQPLRRRIADAAVIGALGAVPVAPYLIRAAVLTGDPVFPYFWRIFGAHAALWNATSNANLQSVLDAFGEGHGFLSFLALPWDITVHGSAFDGSFGPLIVVGAILALTRSPRRLPALIAAGAAIFALLWFWVGGTLQARFLLPGAALLAPFAGAGLQRAARLSARAPRILVAATALACAAAVVVLPIVRYSSSGSQHGPGTVVRDTVNAARYVFGGQSTHAYLAAEIPTYGAEMRLAKLAAPGDRVLVISNYDIDQVDTSIEHVPYFSVSVAGIYVNTREANAALARNRIRFILWGRDVPRSQNLVVVNPAFQRRYLRLVYEDANALLFELRGGPHG